MPDDDDLLRLDAAMSRIRRSIQQRRLGRAMLREVPEAEAAHLGVLDALEATEGAATVGDVAAFLGVDPSAASRRVAAAVESGYVVRVADARDGRRVALETSEAGSALRESIASRRRRLFEAALASMPPRDRSRLASLLTDFVDGLDEVVRRG